MRKSSKLLALLLTLCLLFGAITAIFASAEEGEATPVGGDTIKTDGTTLTGNSNRTPLGASYTEEKDLKNFDYITVDLDITVPAGTPNYHPGLLFQPNAQTITQLAVPTHKNFASFALVEEGGALYVGEVNENAKISETPGVYDHITVICKINKTGEGDTLLASSITTYLYVNGKYVMQDDSPAYTEGAAFTRFAIKKPKGTGAFDAGCGITFEMTACSYNAGSERSAALAAVLESGAPLYTTDSYAVVYNSDFVTPDAETVYFAIDGNTNYFKARDMEMIAAMQDGAEITVSGKALTNVTIPEGVKTFTVTLLNGATFELSDASKAWYEENNGTYTYSKQNITYTDDCSDGVRGDSYPLAGDGNKIGDLGFAYNNSAKSTHMIVTHINNSYARIHYNKDNNLSAALGGDTSVYSYTTMERLGEFAWRPYAYYNEATDLKNMKYVTFDFDFGADAYAYTFTSGGSTYYATAKTEAEALAKLESEQGVVLTEGNYDVTYDLAFPKSADGPITLRPQFMSSVAGVTDSSAAFTTSTGHSTWTMKYPAWLTVYEADGEWYIGQDGSTENSAKLSGVAGVFDHITYVFEVSNVDGVTSIVPHIYVNGEYVYSQAVVTENTGAEFNHFQELIVDFGKDVNKTADFTPAFKMYDRYSIAFDNMAITYYDEEDLEYTTLDDYAEDKAPLYTLENVVYNEGYVTPNPERYATVGADETKYYVIGAAFNKLPDYETIYLHNVGEYALPSGFALNNFTVVASEGVFVPTEADRVRYTITSSGDIHTYVLLRAYVLVNGTEYTLDEAIEIITDGDEIELVRTNMENFNKELTSFTVTCDEYSNFSFASDFPTWKYAKIGDTYTKVINGEIKANLTLFSDRQQFNIYIPLPDAEMGTLEGVKYYVEATGEAEDTNPEFETAVIDGVRCLRLYWNTRMDMNGKTAYAELKYTDAEGNEAILFSRFEAKFQVVNYLIKAAQTFGCGNETAQVIKASGDFRYEVVKVLKPALASAYTAFYNVYEGHTNCKCGGIVDPDATGADYINNPIAPEDDYIKVGAVHEDLEMPEGVSVSYAAASRYFYMYVYGTAGDIVTISYTTVNGNATSKEATIVESNGRAAFTLFSAADVDNEFTITITRPAAEEGEEATTIGSFNYSLADYEATADVADLVKALKNYAIASENFKKYPNPDTAN